MSGTTATATATVVGGLSRDEIRKGIPIHISGTTEMLLIAAVLLILCIPLYLAVRRRSFRRTIER